MGYEPMRPPMPRVTLWLLGTIVGVFVLQLVTLAVSIPLHQYIFVVNIDWYLRPWSLITSTLSHGGFAHLFFNGLFLYFFGSNIEQILGPKRYLWLFFISGALSGVLQVHISFAMTGVAMGALGASGALMMLAGMTIILMPKSQIILFPIPIPIPMYIAGFLFAAFDLLGAFSGGTGIGHFAHLSGMVIGLLYGLRVKDELANRGMRIVYQ